MDDLVILILNYNSFDDTSDCIDSLLKNGINCDIVVVDNNSNDNSYAKLISKYSNNSRIKIIKTDRNLGYAKGNNFGLRYIENNLKDKRYICIMNPDVRIFNKCTIDNLLKIIDSTDIAAISGVQIYNGYLNIKKSAWRLKKYGDILMYYFLLKDLNLNSYSALKVENPKYPLSYVDVLPGCFFIIDKNIFKEIGYFDENTFLYYEEDILFYKLKKYNKKVAVALNSFYYHTHSTKKQYNFKEKLKHYMYAYDSMKYYVRKFLKPTYLQYLFLISFSLVFIYIRIFINVLYNTLLVLLKKNTLEK